MSNLTLTPKAARAISKYSLATCLKAFQYHVSGYGARSIYQECVSGLPNTAAADAAINAGREYTVFTQGDDTLVAVDRAIARRAAELHNDKAAVYCGQVIEDGEEFSLFANVTL